MSLRRQTLWSMLPILVTSIISIVSVPIYFRVLGDQMYALWFYVGTLTGAFGFMDLGLGVAVGRYMGVAIGRNDSQAVKEYWATGNAIVLPFVLLFALVFVTLGAGWGPSWFKVPEQDVSTLRWAMLWGGIGLFFNYYGQMWNILAQTHLDFKFLSILRTWTTVVSSAGAVVVGILTHSVAWIVAYTTVLAGVQFILLFLRGNRHYRLPLDMTQFRKTRLIEMLPYTMKTFAQLISGSVLGSLDRFFLGRFAPALDFAAFNVSMNFGSRISGLSVAIMGPVFNNANRGVGGDKERDPAAIYKESFNFLFSWYSLCIVGVFFWSGPLTDLWLGDKYGSTVGEAFPWIVSALCLQAMANVSSAQLGSLDRVGLSLVFQIIISLSSLFGVVGGWMISGLSGAAIGFFLARFACIIQDSFIRQMLKISPNEYTTCFWIIMRQFLCVGSIWTAGYLLSVPQIWMVGLAAISGISSAAIEIFCFRKAYSSSQVRI